MRRSGHLNHSDLDAVLFFSSPLVSQPDADVLPPFWLGPPKLPTPPKAALPQSDGPATVMHSTGFPGLAGTTCSIQHHGSYHNWQENLQVTERGTSRCRAIHMLKILTWKASLV